MVPDLPGTLFALVVFTLVALAPGWAIGYWFNLLSFRNRFITYKLALAMAFSLAVSPILLVLIVRYTNLRVATGMMLAFDLLAIVAIIHALRARRRRTSAQSARIATARRRAIRWTALAAVVWIVVALVFLLDIRVGDRLFM